MADSAGFVTFQRLLDWAVAPVYGVFFLRVYFPKLSFSPHSLPTSLFSYIPNCFPLSPPPPSPSFLNLIVVGDGRGGGGGGGGSRRFDLCFCVIITRVSTFPKNPNPPLPQTHLPIRLLRPQRMHRNPNNNRRQGPSKANLIRL